MPDPSSRPGPLRTRALLAFAVAGLGLTLYFPLLGRSGLWDPWEPRYAQTAREMAERGDWVVPYYRGDPRLNKAPMTYWLIASAQSLAGVTETAARLPSAILAVVCALGLALAVARRTRPLVGWLVAATLLTSPQWILLGRFATPDTPLAASLGLALACAIALPTVEGRSRIALGVGGTLAIAFAGLVDWPRGLLLPAWALLGWGALSWGWRGLLGLVVVGLGYHLGQLRYEAGLVLASFGVVVALAPYLARRAGIPLRYSLAGMLVVGALVAPWLLATRALEPGEFSLFEYKYAFNLGETPGQHTGAYGYVLLIAAIGAFPWAAASAAGAIEAIRGDELARAAAGAGLGGLLFFTLSEAKMGHFYGVLQPAVAVLAALGLVAFAGRRSWVGPSVAAATLAALAVVLFRDPTRLLESATVKSGYFGLVDPRGPALASAVAWLAVWIGLRLARLEAWLPLVALPPAILAGSLAFHVVPALQATKSLEPAWSTYLEQRGAGEPIAAYGAPKDSPFYYSNNSILRVEGGEELREYLSGPGVKWVILPRTDFRRLERAEGWQLVVDRHPSHVLARWGPDPALRRPSSDG